MQVDDPFPIDPALLPVRSTVVDVITQPDPTPLCQAALLRGCRVQGGRAMHEGQAVYAAKFLDLDCWPAGRPRIDLPRQGGRTGVDVGGVLRINTVKGSRAPAVRASQEHGEGEGQIKLAAACAE